MGEKAGKGGPLGELVQWSDLIAALYMLGHELHISSEMTTLIKLGVENVANDPSHRYMKDDSLVTNFCPVLNVRPVDLIYTDIIGLRQMKKKMNAYMGSIRCGPAH
jgi:hypothetical protein